MRRVTPAIASPFPLLVLTASLAAQEPLATEPEVTAAALLAELVDRRAHTEFPDPPFTTGLASGEHAGPEDETERVLLDTEGPGALVRLWFAGAGERPTGLLRIRVDGGEEPVLAVDLAALTSGAAGVPGPLVLSVDGSATVLLPVPFARRCVVTLAGGDGLAWQLEHRRWDAGVSVESLAAGDLVRLSGELSEAAGLLAGSTFPTGDPDLVGPDQLDPVTGEVRAEVTHPFGHLIGSTGQDGMAKYAGLSNDATGWPSALSELRLLVRDPEPDDGGDLARFLRESRLVLTFDGVDTVDLPVGSFFASEAGPVSFQSRYLSAEVGEDSALFICRFLMPYQRKLFVRVESLMPEPIDLMGWVTLSPHPRTERTLYFHAARRAESGAALESPRDWGAARLVGRGVLLGEAYTYSLPVEAGWSSGASKLYVDAEPVPSSLGTATADDFGSPRRGGPFTTPLFGRLRAGEGGTWSQFRFRALSRVPFFARLDVDRELLVEPGFTSARGELAATAWYYADLEGDPASEDAAGLESQRLETGPTGG